MLIVMCINCSLLFIAESYSTVWLYHSLSLHSPSWRTVGLFEVFGGYEINYCKYSHRFFVIMSFYSSWVSIDSMVLMGHIISICLNLRRHCQINFQSQYTILCSQQQCMGILLAQYLLVICFLTIENWKFFNILDISFCHICNCQNFS